MIRLQFETRAREIEHSDTYSHLTLRSEPSPTAPYVHVSFLRAHPAFNTRFRVTIEELEHVDE